MIKNLIKYSFIISLLFSCTSEKVVKTTAENKYFDLKNYFKLEGEKLQKLNPTVEKKVAINNDIETKKLKIENWDKELSIFADADINKTNWIGSFKIQSTDTTLKYLALDERIAVKQILIKKLNYSIQEIEIIKETKNLVYTSKDTLVYRPNSSYQIKKRQKVYAMKEKSFEINANINKN